MSNILFSNNEDDSNNQNELSGEDSLKLLVGEGKKYLTVEDMAKGMVHGQAHITKLESEATTFKDNQAKQTTIEDVLAELKAGNNNNQPPADNLPPADPQVKDTGQPVDINQQIKDALDARASTDQATVNVQKVTDSLRKALGSRVSEVYSRVGRDLNVNLDELAKTSPDAVISMCTGQQAPAQPQNNLPASTFRSNPDNVNLVDGELNYKGIQELYKKGGMPREKKFQLEQAQAIKLGDKFFN